MAFNATTYRMNSYRKDAWAKLAEARALRERAATGTERWEGEAAMMLASTVRLALGSMRLHLIYRSQRAWEQERRAELRARRSGK